MPPSVSERYVDVPKGVVYLEKQKSFWQIQLDGRTVHVATGNIGTPGRKTKKTHANEFRAGLDHQERIEDALNKGYAYVLTGKPPKKPAAAAANPKLEAEIVRDPSDDALAVYADWLQEHGDVRGELGALQLTGAKQAKKLLWDYRGYFYGPLAVYVSNEEKAQCGVAATWRAGWIDSLTLSSAEGWGAQRTAASVLDAVELVPLVGKVASAKFLRELIIARPWHGNRYQFAPVVAELVKLLPSLPVLRRLTIGRFEISDCELSWSSLGSLAKLWKPAHGLEYVKLRAGSMSLGKISLPACREFWIETGGLSKESLTSITAASWPSLETLNLWFGKRDYGCTCSVRGMQPILDGKGLPRVKHLGLKNTQLGNEVFAEMPKSKILRQLETLDLSMSHITTDALERDVMPHADAFRNLAGLDLSRCLLDDRGKRLAKSLAKHVDVDYQRTRDDDEDGDYRYAAVGE